MFCEKCGSLLLPTFSVRDWEAVCLKCGATQPCDAHGPTEAAELATQGHSYFALQEFETAQARFEEAVRVSRGLLAYRWAALLARYGVKYCASTSSSDGTGYVVNFWRQDIPQELIRDTQAYRELNDAAAAQGTACLKLVRDEVKIIDDGLAQIHQLEREETSFDVFLCFKDTDAEGNTTPERRFLDALYPELVGSGDLRVFFAPRSMYGKRITAFEGSIYTALKTAKLMVVVGSTAENINSPWVASEWGRFLLWGKADRILTLPVGDMRVSHFPPELKQIQSDLAKGVPMNDLTDNYYVLRWVAKEIRSHWEEAQSIPVSMPDADPSRKSGPEPKPVPPAKKKTPTTLNADEQFRRFKVKKRIFWAVYIVVAVTVWVLLQEYVENNFNWDQWEVVNYIHQWEVINYIFGFSTGFFILLPLPISYAIDIAGFKKIQNIDPLKLEKFKMWRWARNWLGCQISLFYLGFGILNFFSIDHWDGVWQPMLLILEVILFLLLCLLLWLRRRRRNKF